MIYVSLIEIFINSKNSLINSFGEFNGHLITIISFFSGILLIMFINRVVPDDGFTSSKDNGGSLYRVGVFTALVLAVHNFPEGFATFVSAVYNPTLGIAITVALAIHNIPEGMSIAVPIYYATGSRKKAFFYSFLTGLVEPLGALIGYLIFGAILNEVTFGIIFGVVAGIMIYISLFELIPSALKNGEEKFVTLGGIVGMLVMAISLLLL
jgi:ZIP family zinc transporter